MRTELEKIIHRIRPLDQAAMAKCQIRLDNLTKPLGSLHAFEHLACKMAGITAQARPRFTEPVLILVDGGKRTPGLTDVFAANVSARLIELNFDAVEASNESDIWTALLEGAKKAAEATAAGATIIGIGLAGESGWQQSETGSAEGGATCSGIDWLLQTGDLRLAALTGLVLGAVAGGAAVALDGAATLLAAEVACEISPPVREYLVCSHFAAEPEYVAAVKRVDLPVYLYLGMNVGEGVGAALGISLIQAALHVVNDMKTFGEAQVSVAEDGPGALVQNIHVRD